MTMNPSKVRPGRRSLLARLYGLRTHSRKVLIDVAAFTAAYVLAYFFRLETIIEYPYDVAMLLTLPFVVAFKVAIFHYVGSYRSFWRYSGIKDLQALFLGTALSAAGVATLAFLVPRELSPPRSLPFIDGMLTLLIAGGCRLLARLTHESGGFSVRPRNVVGDLLSRGNEVSAKRALIVGAGDTGERVVRELLRRGSEFVPVALVDDNPNTHVQRIHGIPVVGGVEHIPRLVEELDIGQVLIAVRRARGRTVQRILKQCKDVPVTLRILDDQSVVGDGAKLPAFRSLNVEDLLGRRPVNLDLESISAYLRGKRILVTGAGGSIGSELCRQILKFAPAELQLFGRGENSIYSIHQELVRAKSPVRLVQVIGDVINRKKIDGVFARLRPEIVFHAAADKHVPLMEANPDEAVLNNILGTKNVLEVAQRHGVERVVCISTDKAVSPSSIMGCCKRVSEMLVQSGLFPEVSPVAVRFANVLASRGSVVPLFEQQIRDGGPITVTDRGITRYFMTIPEAAALVIQAGAIGKGGEIFVLDMGEPVKIVDLARNMIRLAGLDPDVDIGIEEIGLRPGEKMFEELVSEAETTSRTSNDRIIRIQGREVDDSSLLGNIEELVGQALQLDFDGIRETLRGTVPEYLPVAAPNGNGETRPEEPPAPTPRRRRVGRGHGRPWPRERPAL
jgi:FlaA1/EpsC-like NDP-sugar epimerase